MKRKSRALSVASVWAICLTLCAILLFTACVRDTKNVASISGETNLVNAQKTVVIPSANTPPANTTPVSSGGGDQLIPESFGIALFGLGQQKQEMVEVHATQVFTAGNQLNKRFTDRLSSILTGTVTLEFALVYAGESITHTNSWQLYYTPSTLSLSTPRALHDYSAYRIDPPTEKLDHAYQMTFSSAYTITATSLLLPPTGAIPPTNFKGWIAQLQQMGVVRENITHLLLREEANGRSRHILIAFNLNNMGMKGAPDGSVVCGTNWEGYFWCHYVSSFGW